MGFGWQNVVVYSVLSACVGLALDAPSVAKPAPAIVEDDIEVVEANPQYPRASLRYRRDLIRNARFIWGLNAPIATFAGQIHQESAWNPNARSPYAGGLAQFTPDTAKWISGVYRKDLGDNQPYNPTWALRALVYYDLYLWDRTSGATQCDHMAAGLSAYNGGLGWVNRDKRLAKSKGTDPEVWFGPNGVEQFNAGRGAAFFKENRDYPRRILLRNQYIYSSWGPTTNCEGVV